MKKLIVIIISIVMITSCATTKDSKTSRADLRKEKKLLEQATVKNAVESKRYIIKFDRLYFTYGGKRELIPRANFLIVDNNKAILNTAYLGRQFDIKPIAAINIKGRADNYVVTDNLSKRSYEIKMKVNNGGPNTFDVFIRITKNGYCSVSVSSLKIDNINYDGYLVPITDNTNVTRQLGDPI
jgi:Domain of unknown function (DUF4251)